MIIVGIVGPMHSGKDEVATWLTKKWHFARHGFADALKREVETRFRRTIAAYLAYTQGDHFHDFDPIAQEALIHDTVWTHKPFIVRELLQEYGTEVRRADDPTYWIERWCDTVLPLPYTTRIVVPDVRYRNEVAYLRGLANATLVRVTRPGYPAKGHASERDLVDMPCDATIENDGRLLDLYDTVDALIATLLGDV